MAEFSLDKIDGLTANDVVPSIAEHDGHKALRLVLTADAETPDCPTSAMIDGVSFGNGTIELEVVGDTLADAKPAARGFIGVAFRLPMTSRRSRAFTCAPRTAAPIINCSATGPANISPTPITSSISCARWPPGSTNLMWIWSPAPGPGSASRWRAKRQNYLCTMPNSLAWWSMT